MLRSLLGSENRVKIFKIFFSNPEKLFAVNELVKADIGRDQVLRKELDKLAAEGFLKINKETKIKRYQANAEHIFFPEISSVISKEKILSVKDVFSEIKKDFSPRLIFLSGKFVSDSEIPTDLFIVGRLPRRDFLVAIAKLEKKLGYEINFTLMSEQEFDYRREVGDVFLSNVLAGRKIVISGDLT